MHTGSRRLALLQRNNSHVLVSVSCATVSGDVAWPMIVDALCGRGRAVWSWTRCEVVDALCGRGHAVWSWTRCVVVDALCGRGRAVWSRTRCVVEDALCGRGRAVWSWTRCVVEDALCGRGRAVWSWTRCVVVDALWGRGRAVWSRTRCVVVDAPCEATATPWLWATRAHRIPYHRRGFVVRETFGFLQKKLALSDIGLETVPESLTECMQNYPQLVYWIYDLLWLQYINTNWCATSLTLC